MSVTLPAALSPPQQRAIQAAGQLRPEWSEGLQNAIVGLLADPGPWSDSEVQAAIDAVLTNYGIDAPLIAT